MDKAIRPAFEDVMARMKAAAGLKNNSAVAASLGMTPQALSNYKKRGYVPSDLIVRFALKHNLSIDSLVFGPEGPAAVAREAMDELEAGL